MLNIKLFLTTEKFVSLTEVASRNGGLWISAGGGTWRVAAGVIARQLGVSFEEAYNRLLDKLEELESEDYIPHLQMNSSQSSWHLPEDEYYWDVRTIAKAACRFS